MQGFDSTKSQLPFAESWRRVLIQKAYECEAQERRINVFGELYTTVIIECVHEVTLHPRAATPIGLLSQERKDLDRQQNHMPLRCVLSKNLFGLYILHLCHAFRLGRGDDSRRSRSIQNLGKFTTLTCFISSRLFE